MRTIKQRIYDIIAKVSDRPSQPMTPLMELGCDSLDMIDMEMKLESEFDISFPNEPVNRILTTMTAHDVVCLVEYEYLKIPKE